MSTTSTRDLIALLMAPLPADEEQANSRKFMRQLAKDRAIDWQRKFQRYRDALAARNAMTDLPRMHKATEELRGIFLEFMETPSPARLHLETKKGYRRFHDAKELCDKWIARDEAFFAIYPK